MNWKTFFKKGKLLVGIPILLLGVFVFLQPSFAKNFIIAPNSTDRVSIGTTVAPGYTLDVAGTGRFTGALIVPTPSTANEAATKAYVDSTVGGSVGAGTSGQTLRHNGTSWVANSVLYNNGTNVGIGTTGPGSKLHVTGITQITDGVANADTASYGTFGVTRPASANTLSYITMTRAGNVVKAMGIDSSNRWVFGHPAATTQVITPYMTIDNSGKVGIGTTGPGAMLDVVQSASSGVTSIYPNTSLALESATDNFINFRNTADNGTYQGLVFTDNNHGGYITYLNWNGALPSDSMFLGAYQDFYFQTGTSGVIGGKSTVMTVKQSGNVGIGTTAPGEKLQVGGNLRLGSSNSSNYISFYGITGDNPGGFDHTYIGERFYAPDELSELFLFKGNDIPGPGPDRVRIGAAEFRVDTFTSPLSGTFEDVANSGLLVNRFIINNAGNVGIGTAAPAYKLDISGTGRFTGSLIVPTPSTASHAATKGYVDSIVVGHGDGTNCSTGYFAAGVDASGNAQGCANSIANSTNASYATNAGYADSAGTAGALSSTSLCSSGYYARGITTSGAASGCTAVPTGGHGDGTNCSAGYYPLGVDASGNVQSCTAVPTGGHGDGANCAAGSFPLGVDANGAAESCTSLTNATFSPTFGTVTASSFVYSSDAKLKTNIKTIKDPLEKITALRGVTFNWKDSKKPSVGLIAQEVEQVFPELVKTNGEYKAVEYGNLIAPLIEAVKAQQEQIEVLEARIATLESDR